MKKQRPNLTDILNRPDTSQSFRALNPGLADPRALAPNPSAFPRKSEPDLAQGPRREKKQSHGERLMQAFLERRLREGGIKRWQFEAITLVVGTNTCRYTPDFLVELPEGKPLLLEIKGKKKWEDAVIKYKAAEAQWGWLFDFQFWECSENLWRQIY